MFLFLHSLFRLKVYISEADLEKKAINSGDEEPFLERLEKLDFLGFAYKHITTFLLFGSASLVSIFTVVFDIKKQQEDYAVLIPLIILALVFTIGFLSTASANFHKSLIGKTEIIVTIVLIITGLSDLIALMIIYGKSSRDYS